MPKREVGQITGTNSDLRRLSMEKSREILLSLGITDGEIKGACCVDVQGNKTTFCSYGSAHACGLHRGYECQSQSASWCS